MFSKAIELVKTQDLLVVFRKALLYKIARSFISYFATKAKAAKKMLYN